MRNYFLESERLGFSHWSDDEIELAYSLWGDADVVKFITDKESFSKEDVMQRLKAEIENQENSGVQCWPFFEKATGKFVGSCGFRLFEEDETCLEMGVYLKPEFWGKGYAKESAQFVINFAFDSLHAPKIYVGHHPENVASRTLIKKLGFRYIKSVQFEPTGLIHPLYVLTAEEHNGTVS